MLGWELPPHNSGGLGVACAQLCKALANNGADIEFILPYSSDHDFDFMRIVSAYPDAKNVDEFVQLAYDSKSFSSLEHKDHLHKIIPHQIVYEQAVERLVKLKEFDVIHAHDWLTFRAGMRAKAIKNRPLILHVHSIERDRAGGNYGNPIVREIESTALLMADRVIAVSEHTKQQIIDEYSIPTSKVEVVHNSIELDSFEQTDNENLYNYFAQMRHHGYRVVTYVGRITVQKGLPNLLRAAKIVIDHHPKTFFLFVGTGEQKEELIELSAELGIADKTFFTGFLRGQYWRDSFSIADLFVMPSISEPFGLAPLEAIGYGSPVLISKQSGVSEVLKNCLKVDFWDVDEMANQISSVVSNDSLRDELHANALEELNRMSWQNAAVSLFGIYNHHLEASRV